MLETLLAQRYLNGVDQTPNLPPFTGYVMTRWIDHEYQSIVAKGKTEQNEHPLLDEQTNEKFQTYLESGRSDFILNSQFEAYEKAKHDLFTYLWEVEKVHLSNSVSTLELYPTLDKILFSEIVLKAAARLSGEPAPQKIVF